MQPMSFEILRLTEATEDVARQLDALFCHLTSVPRPELTAERLRDIVAQPDAALFVAIAEGQVVGSLTICHNLLPVGEKWWIEDVVTLPAVRGKGVGRALVERGVAYAAEIAPGVPIYLTSNPARTAARELYRSVGFEEYQTGVFRLK
ncbi:MAG: GNAT family N-acetyltransferase [Rikenellaceae bacterium]|nr:GNAT family N-acetyltransferase [Rikenellaceae bacterium]